MSESTMRYDPENDIFFHKHEDGSWSAYFCERHESLEEDEVRPYRGSFEPVGVAHPMTSHIQPLAAEARPVRSRGHRVKHDSRMLDRPPRRVGAVNVPYSPRSSSRWSHSFRAMFVPVDVIFQEIHVDTSWGGNIASK